MEPYFTELPSDKFGQAVMERVERYYRSLEASGQLDVMMASVRAYYGMSFNNSDGSANFLSRGGRYGQLRKVRVNHVRNLGLHLLQLTTSQRPAPVPVASNSDSESQEAVTVARGVLDYYSRFMRVERYLRKGAEAAIVTGAGYVDVSYDMGLGRVTAIHPDSQKVMHEGDLKLTVMSALEVGSDVSPGGETQWRFAIKPINKYDLVESLRPVNPDQLDDDTKSQIEKSINAIMAAPSIGSNIRRNRRPYHAMLSRNNDHSTDAIAVIEFSHERTPACPNGKFARMTENGFVFDVRNLPPGVDGLTLRRISAGDVMDTPFAYGPLFDLLGIQEIIDALYSAVASNQMTFATQLIWSLKSADFDYRQLATGISLLEGNDASAKPEPLQLVKTAPEVFDFIRQLEGAMETLSGVNATVRGNPEYSLKSGSALALIQSQAIQFASTLQHQYAQLVEDVYTDMLGHLAAHATEPREIIVVGKFNKPYMRSFSSEDIQGVKRVIVDVGPSATQTTAWKQEVAKDLATTGIITTPEEYLQVALTGRLEPMVQGDNAELMLVNKENEFLKEGKPVYALPYDKHVLHIKEHRCTTADPEVRSDQQLLKVVGDHIAQHIQFLSDPQLAQVLTVLGETPLAAANIPPEQAAGGTPPGPAGQAPTAPPNKMPNMPKKPNMPQAQPPPAGDAQDGSQPDQAEPIQ